MERQVIGYTRISRVGGRRGQGFISKEDQEDGIKVRATDLALAIVDWAHDPDYSGGNLQRPEWERVMSRILAPDDPVVGVIVVRVDRFARTVPEGAPEVRRIWDSNGRNGDLRRCCRSSARYHRATWQKDALGLALERRVPA